MKVQNLNGTSGNTCYCGSWLAHWEKFSNQTAQRCVVTGCSNKQSIGGHVQKSSTIDHDWYIIPICAECNNKRGQTLDIDNAVNLVSANVCLTCGGLGLSGFNKR